MIAMNIFAATALVGKTPPPFVEEGAVVHGDLGFAAAMTLEGTAGVASASPALSGAPKTGGQLLSAPHVMPASGDGLPGEILLALLPQAEIPAKTSPTSAPDVPEAVRPGQATPEQAALPLSGSPPPDTPAPERPADKSTADKPTADVTPDKSPRTKSGRSTRPHESPKAEAMPLGPLAIPDAPKISPSVPSLVAEPTAPTRHVDALPENQSNDWLATAPDARTSPEPVVIETAATLDRPGAVILVASSGGAIRPLTQEFHTNSPGPDPVGDPPACGPGAAPAPGAAASRSAPDQTGARPEPVSPRQMAGAASPIARSTLAPEGAIAQTKESGGRVRMPHSHHSPTAIDQLNHQAPHSTSQPEARSIPAGAPLAVAMPRSSGDVAQPGGRAGSRPAKSAPTVADFPPEARSTPAPAPRQTLEPQGSMQGSTVALAGSIIAARARDPSPPQPGPTPAPGRLSSPIGPGSARPVEGLAPQRRQQSAPVTTDPPPPSFPTSVGYHLTQLSAPPPLAQQSATPELRRASGAEPAPSNSDPARFKAPSLQIAALQIAAPQIADPQIAVPPRRSAQPAKHPTAAPALKALERPATRVFASFPTTTQPDSVSGRAAAPTNPDRQGRPSEPAAFRLILTAPPPTQSRVAASNGLLSDAPLLGPLTPGPAPALVLSETASASDSSLANDAASAATAKLDQPVRPSSTTAPPAWAGVRRHENPKPVHIPTSPDAAPRRVPSGFPGIGPAAFSPAASASRTTSADQQKLLLPEDKTRPNSAAAQSARLHSDPPREHRAPHAPTLDAPLQVQRNAESTGITSKAPVRVFTSVAPLKGARLPATIADADRVPPAPCILSGGTRVDTEQGARPDLVASVQPAPRPATLPQHNAPRNDFVAQPGHRPHEIRGPQFRREPSESPMSAAEGAALRPTAPSVPVVTSTESRVAPGLDPGRQPSGISNSRAFAVPPERSGSGSDPTTTSGSARLGTRSGQAVDVSALPPVRPPQGRSAATPERPDQPVQARRHPAISNATADVIPSPDPAQDIPRSGPFRTDLREAGAVRDGKQDGPLPFPDAAPVSTLPAVQVPQTGGPIALAVPDLAGPSSHPTPPAGLHDFQSLPRHLPASLARAAARADRDDRVELFLDPVELGRVRFELSSSADRVQVNVSVERPETLDLLRRNIDVLRAEFREAGFDAATLSFSQWGKGGDPTPDVPFATPHLSSDAPDEDPAPPAPSPQRNMSRNGLDLRL